MPTRFEKANALRALAMDAVQKAKSGHPGMPMGMADIAEVLWNDFLRFNPTNPNWINRDRFVISNGHGSMLQYALLHLSGFDVSISDLQNFRQLHSKTPGHPEYGYTPGIETTTGPLGQGLANAVGMALAEKILAAQFNRDTHKVVDHHTYVFLGDGCLMEGISHEVCSLAGTLGLGKLICLYDDNGISIDGEVEGWFSDDTARRFEAYGWQVIPHVDGHDPEEIQTALQTARADTQRPTLICCKTIIGFGAPTKAGKEDCHGAPLGDAEIAGAREKLNWSHAPFVIPETISSAWNARERGATSEQQWQQTFAEYQATYPELASELLRRMSGELPAHFAATAASFIADVDAKAASIASRKASENALNALAPQLPELLGGSADLAGSNLTLWKGSKGVSDIDAGGNYLYYGVREFGMSAIMNGITLHGGFIPYGGTFLIFMEYARNAVRMAALMKQRSIFVYTHDSIGLGEDGPTHQPIEQLNNLRGTPHMHLWRPCDAVESAVSWVSALQRKDGPSALVFSRQNLAHQMRNAVQISAISKGAYVLSDSDAQPDLILIATGSEVALAQSAAQVLRDTGKRVRVVSMPCSNLFDAQDAAYRESVLPNAVRKRIAIEAGHVDFWFKYVGIDGRVIGMQSFGESAPGDKLMAHFGFTVDNVVKVANELF